jgi:hypothetical protein
LPLLEWIIFTKCGELKNGNKFKFTDVTKSYYKNLLESGIDLYGEWVGK